MQRNIKKVKGLFNTKLPNLLDKIKQEDANKFNNNPNIGALLLLISKYKQDELDLTIEKEYIYFIDKETPSIAYSFADNYDSENKCYPIDAEYTFDLKISIHNSSTNTWETIEESINRINNILDINKEREDNHLNIKYLNNLSEYCDQAFSDYQEEPHNPIYFKRVIEYVKAITEKNDEIETDLDANFLTSTNSSDNLTDNMDSRPGTVPFQVEHIDSDKESAASISTTPAYSKQQHDTESTVTKSSDEKTSLLERLRNQGARSLF